MSKSKKRRKKKKAGAGASGGTVKGADDKVLTGCGVDFLGYKRLCLPQVLMAID